jgi:CRP/FNR family transcriptional regulator, cyclic AMP receptor protein
MSQPEIAASHPFFHGLSEPYRAQITAAAKPFTAEADEYLAKEGKLAQSFYLIQSGQVAIGIFLAKRGEMPIQTVGAGEIVGWSWLVPPYRWQFDARALGAVRGLLLDGDWLREQCEQDPALGYQVLKQLLNVVGSRLTATRLQRLDIYR